MLDSRGTQGSKFFPYVSIWFVVAILISNVTSCKLVEIGPLVLAGGTLFFPLTYLAGDTITETWGFAATRKIIWMGLLSLLAMTLATTAVQFAPAPAFWDRQDAYDKILGVLWRTNIAGFIAYLCGEFVNSYVLSKMKRRSSRSGKDERGFYNRGMYARFVASTVLGQAVDSAVFISIAFFGVYDNKTLLIMFASSWGVKVGWEIIALRFTVPVVCWIKKNDQTDVIDVDEDYAPWKF